MSPLPYMLDSSGLAPAVALRHASAVAVALSESLGRTLYPSSLAAVNGVVFALDREENEKRILVIRRKSDRRGGDKAFKGRSRTVSHGDEALTVKSCAATRGNIVALQAALPYLKPTVLGLRRSFGCGDRLGIATPAHVRAIRGTGVAPIFSQQSIREMTRTGRTPNNVMDDAVLGVFQEGWRDGFGSDADHLKSMADIDRCAKAGFTMFTVDPGDHVDDAADAAAESLLRTKFKGLPWKALDSSAKDCAERYLRIDLEVESGFRVRFTEEALLRAAVKYGRAIVHTVKMFRRAQESMGKAPFELEMSVDETLTPTSELEHFYVASELRRLGVVWKSLAPRFIGDFEKGIDYKGNLRAFRRSFAHHVSIAEHFGGYKISIHSGSDKFSIYAVAGEVAGDLLHVKTAGTSYLEALRAVAHIDPALFRKILTFSRQRYTKDRASYHVSGRLKNVPTAKSLKDGDLPALLESVDARQVLHVTYGSVLTAKSGSGDLRFRGAMLHALRSDEETHYDIVKAHIDRHLRPIEL